MKKFKTWLEENIAQGKPSMMGQPKGPAPMAQDQMATNLVNQSLTRKPQFLSNLAKTNGNAQKLSLIGQQTGDIIRQNPTAVKSTGISADLLNQKVADLAGINLNQAFMSKK